MKRYIHIALVVIVTAVVLLFTLQNLSLVALSFLGMSVTMPVSVLVPIVYVLGMATGSVLLSGVRGWVRGARAKDSSP